MTTPTPSPIGKGRIEALADGVFAIALTLLALDIKVPSLAEGEGGAELAARLLALWPKFAAFVVSFLVLGVLWVGHHAQLHFVRRSDRPFMWMNLVFLLLISAVPFSAALFGDHHRHAVAAAFYCGNLVLAGLVLYAQLRYAAAAGLLAAGLDAQFLAAARRRLLLGPALYSAAFILAFVDTRLSLALCAAVPLLYLLPGRVDEFWKEGPT